MANKTVYEMSKSSPIAKNPPKNWKIHRFMKENQVAINWIYSLFDVNVRGYLFYISMNKITEN